MVSQIFFKFEAFFGLEALKRLHEADEAGRNEIIEFHAGGQASAHFLRHDFYEREIFEHQSFAGFAFRGSEFFSGGIRVYVLHGELLATDRNGYH